jgi:ubiquinone/menaquinone biosynthesis C-methylase UbiE
MQNENSSRIFEVYLNVEAHRLTADIVRGHSTNKQDVRETALKNLDLSQCRNILDLGCGFGFFAEALAGRVHPQAFVVGLDIIKEYESSFLNTCKRSHLRGLFLSSDACSLKNLQDHAFDLVLCSYALYFFPEIIPQISRVLKPEGSFVSITHCEENMREFISEAKETLMDSHFIKSAEQPIESIVRRFSSQNGYALLSSSFRTIIQTDYRNSLLFKEADLPDLVEYFRFKSPFFLSSGISLKSDLVCDLLKHHLEGILRDSGHFRISKDDTIFICTEPIHGITNR